jgi:hypothetical protein
LRHYKILLPEVKTAMLEAVLLAAALAVAINVIVAVTAELDSSVAGTAAVVSSSERET